MRISRFIPRLDSLSLECARISAKCRREIDDGPTWYLLRSPLPSSLPSPIHVASRPLSPCCARVSTTCRAFSGSVLSRWLLSQRHREGGVLRLVRSIAIKDLVTRLGAALRSASSSLYIALARCVKQFICIEANAPGVVALHSSLIFPLFLPISLFLYRGMWIGWLGNISFEPVFESYTYPSSGCANVSI